MKKLGCLVAFVLLIVLAIVGWFTRASWMRVLPGQRETVAIAPTWQPLTPAGAQRAKGSLERLRVSNGPVSVNVAPGDLAAYIFQELSRTLPSSADSIEAAAIGDRLYVRAIVRTADLGNTGGGALGPLSMLLGERERLQLGGTFRIIRPGLAELQVKELRIRDFNVPQGLIPRLVRQISRGERPAELAPDGLPLRTPDYIGDVKVSSGQITLYRSK